MQIQRQFAEIHSTRLTIDLPESFLNHKVEVIVSMLDEDLPNLRRPHPDIAGKLIINGDLLDSAPASDWDLPV
ncbi:MAG: hypothetical protein NTX45_14190 [Proteobacteria bacterium]|nr:hypothetical protein [Pseudomonadota bacterium]